MLIYRLAVLAALPAAAAFATHAATYVATHGTTHASVAGASHGVAALPAAAAATSHVVLLRGAAFGRREAAPCMAAADDSSDDQPPTKSNLPEGMPERVLGWPMDKPWGSLGASVTVAVLFCSVVELIKAFDPRPEVVSLFGKF